MINELNEKMKEYSDKYFIKEFKKSKPSVAYGELEFECYVLLASLIIVGIGGGASLICGSCAWPQWFWKVLSMGLGAAVLWWLMWRLERRKTNILFEMACAYLEKHSDIRGKLQNSALLTTHNTKKQYIQSIKKAYRAEIVRIHLGNDYSISTIKALKDEVEIKDVKFGLNFVSICSFLALSVSLVAWYGFDIKTGWPWVLAGFVILLAAHTIIYVFKLGGWEFCTNKKHKELRETLSFILYDYM